MTVYVDNYRAPATVGRIRGRWSHLTADTVDELHAFADRLGHRREWFQARCKHTKCPAIDGVCVHFHYDVVDSNRTKAITLGATPVDIREMGAIASARRAAFRAASTVAEEKPRPDRYPACTTTARSTPTRAGGAVVTTPDSLLDRAVSRAVKKTRRK